MLIPASWPPCDRKCCSKSVFWVLSVFFVFPFSPLRWHVVALSSRFIFVSALVCLWCSCLFRCLPVRSFLLLLVLFVNVGRSVEAAFQKYCSEEPLGIAARNHYSKSQACVALGSVTLHSALPSYVYGYARGHTSIYIYIYIYHIIY